jgi:hypothetical protein
MKNWKFNALVGLCGLLWMGIGVAGIFYKQALIAMPLPGLTLLSMLVSTPILMTMGLLIYQIKALKTDEYQQLVLRAQLVWASIVAMMISSTIGFSSSFQETPYRHGYFLPVFAWYVAFLLRGLSRATRL